MEGSRRKSCAAVGLAALAAFLLALPAGRSRARGGWILFASARDGDFELYAMTPDGSSLRTLTRNAAFDGFRPGRPTAPEILFSSDRSGDLELYVMR